jgi:P27 family predicted phage terminase small subunit
VAPELKRLGLATVVDRTALSAYCQAYARWRQAEEVLTREGLVFETGSGYLMPRPEVAIAQKSMQIMKGFASEFGFTPASRTRISVPEQKPADPFAEFLSRSNAVGE